MKTVIKTSVLLASIYTFAAFSYAYYKFSIVFQDHKVLSSAFSDENLTLVAWVLFTFASKTLAITIFASLVAAISFYGFFKHSRRGWHKEIPEACAVAGIMLSGLIIHFWNITLFPHSQWKLNISSTMHSFTAYFLTPVLIIIVTVGIKRVIADRVQRINFWKSIRTSIIASIILLGGISTLVASDQSTSQIDPNAQNYPNILIIGIDSLRLDQLSRNGGPQWVTPTINKELQKSIIFDNAYTPLARTFPSWVTILTGQVPVEHKVRYNLAKIDNNDLKPKLLTTVLKSIGYRTVYATDERRFSNIDENFNFDHIIGPELGIADFIEGNINDFPTNNLVIFSPLGELFFPFNALNRASYITYTPRHFASKVRSFISTHKRDNQPLFVATHLCLAHWPYSWRTSPASNSNPLEEYQFALNRVDTQIKTILSAIENEKRNTIVVLLSDHGEALGLTSDTPKPLVTGHNHPEPRHGHGTNVSSLTQYQVLLAFRTMTPSTVNHGIASEKLASLADIKPTILAMIRNSAELKGKENIQFILTEENSTGIDLTPWLNSGKVDDDSRTLDLETGFSISAITHANPDIGSVLRGGIKHYEISKTGRLTVKKESGAIIESNKSFAKVNATHLYSTEKSGNMVRHRVIDTKTNETLKDWLEPTF